MYQVNAVAEFIVDSKLFYLATNGENGPDVRPMGLAIPFEDKLYFIAGTQMNIHKQLQASSQVSISAYDGKKWLRLYGTAVLDESAETARTFRAMDEKIASTFPAEVIAPYYLKDVNATFASFSGEEEHLIF